MTAIISTIVAANVALALVEINTIQNLVTNGNSNLLTASQNVAMQNIQTLLLANPGGLINFTFTSNIAADFLTFASVINNLANTGPTLTNIENLALAGNVVPITSNGFPFNAQTVTFNDGYFICEFPGTGQFAVSHLDDGTQWDPLAVGTAEATSDIIIAVDVLNGELITWGLHTIQYFTDQGLVPQPYLPIQGATQQYGLAAVYSRAPFENSIAFLGQNFEGSASVYILSGYTPTRISTPDIDNLINSFTSINDALAGSMVVDGHNFYILTFPVAGFTFLYDGLTQIWSTLQSGISEQARYNSNFFVNFNGQNFASDFISGNVYFQAVSVNQDNGNPIKRQLTTRHVYDQGNDLGIDQIYLDMDIGHGAQPGNLDANPTISMFISKDGGKTFGNERAKSMGKVGQYRGPRITWYRMGSARDFVFKFITTANVPFIMNYGAIVTRDGTEPR